MVRNYSVTDGSLRFDPSDVASRAERWAGSMTIHIGTPSVVTQSAGRCWFPDILRFPTGELMVNYSLNRDTNFSTVTGQAVLVSTDGGETWGTDVPPYDVNGFHNAGGEIRTPLPDGSIVGIGSFVQPRPSGQWRRFGVHYWRYDKGGRRYSVEPYNAVIEGLPRDAMPFRLRPDGLHPSEGVDTTGLEPDAEITSRWQAARVNPFGDAVEVEAGRWIATVSLRFAGDERESTVAVESTDELRTWRYVGTIAGPDDIAGASEGFDEACMVLLDDGDLLCISRVGSRQALVKTYSSDLGRTWTPPEELPAWSVAPQILKLRNGVLVLSTGRPGVYVWVCDDGRGTTWHPVEIAPGYHNAVMPREHHITQVPESIGSDHEARFQTTAYTGMVEGRPNTVYLAYDRTAAGWLEPGSVPGGDRLSCIYLLPMTVARE